MNLTAEIQLNYGNKEDRRVHIFDMNASELHFISY